MRLALLVLTLLLSNLLVAGNAASLQLRDAQTGLGLTGTVLVRWVEEPVAAVADVVDEWLTDEHSVARLEIDRTLELAIERPAVVRAEVPGYRPLHTVLRLAPDNRGWTLMLDPIDPAPIPVAQTPDRLRVSGWVSDHQGLKPVPDARITVGHDGARALSGVDGYFEIDVAALPVVDDVPGVVQIEVTAPGYPAWTFRDALAASGGVQLQVQLGGPSPDQPVHRQLGHDPVWPEADPGPRRSVKTRTEIGDQPPASITVGFADAGCTESCCTGSCPHACTFSLEKYTRRGLPKEWIASWAHDALAAGAVAYRSYGAWHVFNPPAHGAYDLCSSACCQVNAPGTVASTNQAQAATAGLMLTHSGEVFRSEYSAQNNCLLGNLSCTNIDLSCGNGFVGSPAANWPCLQDDVGLDRDCFGHGRGMSQWGNHFWTQESPPRNWKWQLNHYYNASGNGESLRNAFISQVLVIDAVRVMPDYAGPGMTIDLELDVRNLAAETHEHVLIGASLRQPPGPFIDDPANDQPVSLPPGSSTVSRSFTIPADAQQGAYDVYTSLFIDVDQNQSVSSDDLPQHLVVMPGALQLDWTIFADRFLPPDP
jgi:hypothetical protein